MKHAIKISATRLPRIVMNWICLSSLLLVSNCKGCAEPAQRTQQKEIITFYGNPGVGKSTLCNTIFQQPKFQSGINTTTPYSQEYSFQNKLYIDTPGLAAEGTMRKTAQEIETALKKGGNYKIVFVFTLTNCRPRPEDIVTANIICEAIHSSFEYGVIINKVETYISDKEFMNSIKFYSNHLTKKPSLTCVVKRFDNIGSKERTFIRNLGTQEVLLNFITQLQASKISPEDIKPIDITGYKKKINQLQQALNQALNREQPS